MESVDTDVSVVEAGPLLSPLVSAAEVPLSLDAPAEVVPLPAPELSPVAPLLALEPELDPLLAPPPALAPALLPPAA